MRPAFFAFPFTLEPRNALWRRMLVQLPLVTAVIGACSQPPPPPTIDSVALLPAPKPISTDSTPSNEGIVPDPAASIIVRSDTGRLEIPRILRDFCEGEGCAFGYSLVACTTLILQSADSSKAPEIGRVNAGDTVLVETGNLHVLAPGLVVMRGPHVASFEAAMYATGIPAYDSLQLSTGDSLLLLEYHGEGDWAVGHEGRWMIVDEFWAGPVKHGSDRWDDKRPAMSLSAPEIVQWLRLRSASGNTGWWREEHIREERRTTVRPDWGESCGPKK